MKKITIKEIIDFRRKSQKSRQTFIKNLSKEKKEVTTEQGGDYWISAISAISRAFKNRNRMEITDKIDNLLQDIENTGYKRTKMMYQRNVDILYNFEDYDFNSLRPVHEISFLKKPEMLSIIDILKLPVKINPHYVYTFEQKGIKYIGGLWITSKLGGYTYQELASFTEGLYKYLSKNYSQEFTISSEYCIALDVSSSNKVSHSEIEQGTYVPILESTIELIKEII
ncbi:hypothetical protein D1631_16680 [Chryseobacterium nematophagum]|uniref:Uncharacterized protein n=1 Tax=Chryseobacterium nematophagum TaxID=2305228 RepID=A0A3M7TKJ9_9FLAO|nr:hypothetical protein [Chryseobacterium nematophagum]RNA63437.1 hypothetical protein D1631_16680 [Chryseobacterium nematophagum]